MIHLQCTQSVLKHLGLNPKEIQPAIDQVISDMDTIAVTKTKDRALIGNMNSLANDYQHMIMASGGLNACDLTEIILRVNSGPQRRLGWSTSAEVTKQLISSPA